MSRCSLLWLGAVLSACSAVGGRPPPVASPPPPSVARASSVAPAVTPLPGLPPDPTECGNEGDACGAAGATGGPVLAPRTGVTAPQGGALAEERARAVRLVDEATQQIERLRRLTAGSSDVRKVDAEAALSEVATTRERVLQDIRDMDLFPAGDGHGEADLFQQDISALRHALGASYSLAMPVDRGMPPPAPGPAP